jgi:hypothetical protein
MYKKIKILVKRIIYKAWVDFCNYYTPAVVPLYYEFITKKKSERNRIVDDCEKSGKYSPSLIKQMREFNERINKNNHA